MRFRQEVPEVRDMDKTGLTVEDLHQILPYFIAYPISDIEIKNIIL